MAPTKKSKARGAARVMMMFLAVEGG
jgi:hypothetical protein